MSFTEVRPYIRTRMNGLNYEEHKDGFDYENIPSTLLHKSYHIESSSISATSTGNGAIDCDVYVILRVFISGYKYPADGIDSALSRAEVILQDLIAPENRSPTCVQNILMDNINILPLSDSNNNAIILEVSLTANVLLVI